MLVSNCKDHFGHADFDPGRVAPQYPQGCPVRGCTASLEPVPYRKGQMKACMAHGIRLHNATYVYWNGEDRESRAEAQLRNFRFRPDLANLIALGSAAKAESHRLGNELSEDAITWNVFVALAESRLLRVAAEVLTGQPMPGEPDLYLWGQRVDLVHMQTGLFEPLKHVRDELEKGIGRMKTEPDINLDFPGGPLISIEAKFGSANPIAHKEEVRDGEKPVERSAILARYLDRAGYATQRAIDRNLIGEPFHSQLFRNTVFASEMANGREWFVVNLVSKTQWSRYPVGKAAIGKYSVEDPQHAVRAYLSPDHKHRFAFRTWEELYSRLIRHQAAVAALARYMETKSAHYLPAFEFA